MRQISSPKQMISSGIRAFQGTVHAFSERWPSLNKVHIVCVMSNRGTLGWWGGRGGSHFWEKNKREWKNMILTLLRYYLILLEVLSLFKTQIQSKIKLPMKTTVVIDLNVCLDNKNVHIQMAFSLSVLFWLLFFWPLHQ